MTSIQELQNAKEQLEKNPRLMVEFDGDGERNFKVLPDEISQKFIPLIKAEIDAALSEQE